MSEPSPTPKRPVSPRKLAANRANARKSTGPKTPEGKARSRANALRHGLASEVLRTPELEAEYRRLAAAYEDRYHPTDDVERGLAHAAAWGACRFDQARRRQLANERLRKARAAFDAAAALDAAVARLADEPAGALRELTGTVAGVERLIAEWTALRATLAEGQRWCDEQRDRALNLLGLTALAAWTPAGRAVARACFALGSGCPWGLHTKALSADRVHGTHGRCVEGASRITQNPPSRQEALATLLGLADTQLRRLEELREALAPIEASEPAAPVSDDREERLWRRYEVSARGTWNAALGRLRAAQADRRREEGGPPARRRDEPIPATPAMSLASTLQGRSPEAMIAVLRARLRELARSGAPNEANEAGPLPNKPRPGEAGASPRASETIPATDPEPPTRGRKQRVGARSASLLVPALLAVGLVLGSSTGAGSITGRRPAAEWDVRQVYSDERPIRKRDGRSYEFASRWRKAQQSCRGFPR
jgi:hypothetical protein